MKTIVKKRSAKPAQAVVKPAPGLVKPDMWRLRLYVAGQTPKSLTAFANLKRLCEERLRDRYAIEVVDLLEQPQLAKDDQILAIPTVGASCRRRCGKSSATFRTPSMSSSAWTCWRKRTAPPAAAGLHRPMKRKTSKSTSATAVFEAFATRVQPRYILRLYVTGMTPRSSRAISNAKAICEKHLEGRYDLRVIDVYQEPAQVANEQIVALPLLIKELPRPVRRIVGDLADTDRTLRALDLKR